MLEWISTGFLAGLLMLVFKLWRDYHNLDKRLGDIEKEQQLREKIKMEQLLERTLKSGGSDD